MAGAEELIQRKIQTKNKCFFGVFPNPKTRYHLSKKVKKKALAMDELCTEEMLDPISSKPPLQQIVEPSVYNPEALPSRVLIRNQVINALKDPDMDIIGVFGMGGVGKTTLAREIYAKVLQEKLFSTVVMVVVPQAADLGRIQAQIADSLGIKFSVEGIPARAGQLRRRLENSNVLIIVDNLWQKVDFNDVGIHYRGAFKGQRSKMFLTSRDRDLLCSAMGAEKVFSLEPLDDKEALSLIQFSVADAKDPKFHAVATQIVKKCCGLPILIRIVAAELKGSDFAWDYTLEQLLCGDEEIYRTVYNVLEMSYNYLPDEEMKSFFLLCALFQQSNIQIQHLLIHSIGLGLFKNIGTIEDARNKVLTFIANLKSKSLLLDRDIEDFVEMHDLVRETALDIAFRLQHAFIGTGEVRSRDWPDKDCTRICLSFCKISDLPAGLDFPRAELFSLSTEDLSLRIPNSFFENMKILKVVNLTGMCLPRLPSSIGLLVSLRTLCLQRCQLDNVAVLGELINLEFLSFAFSNLVDLPREIEHLIRLKLLDLNGCSDLQVIPSNLLPKLSLLEELYMLNSFVRWNSKGNANIKELYSLSHLSSLEIEIQDPMMIPKGFKCFTRLRRYKMSIGEVWGWKGHCTRSRTLKLKAEDNVRLKDGIELLLKMSEDLYLDGLRGIESVFYKGFPLVKHLHLQNDCDIECLIKSTSQGSSNAFKILESLNLLNLPRLEKICSRQLRKGSFTELQILKISNCNRLVILLTSPLRKCLQLLRELEVESCERMEAVVGEGIEDEHRNSSVIEFTQLRSLKLKKLPHLISFCKLDEQNPQRGLFFSSMVTFPNLRSLEVSHMGKVKCLCSSNGCSRMFPALQSLSATWMENLTEWISKFDSKKGFVFPRLKNVSIQYCPRLTDLPITDPSKLVKLEMKDCPELIPIVGPNPSFASLAGLSITGCPKLTDLQIRPRSMEAFKELTVRKCEWLTFVPHNLQRFCYVTSLEIYCCKRLRQFPEDILSKLTKLQHLSVGAFSEELDDFHYLNRIKDLKCLEELEIWGSDFFGRGMCTLPNQLQYLSVLKSLKIVGFTAMEALPEWFTNLQNVSSLSLDYCRNLKCESTVAIIQRLPNLFHLGVSCCPILQESESELLHPSHSRKIEVELSLVSKVDARLGY